MKNKIGRIIYCIGIVCIILSLSLCSYNVYDSLRSYYVSKHLMSEYHPVKVSSGIVPDYVLNPDMEMPEQKVDGIPCVGILEIPSLNLKLCVTSTFSYEYMKKLPCRYYGSIYKNNMVIAAHNSWFHFGRLNTLHNGDKIIFTDVNGNSFEYGVDAIEALKPNSVEAVTNGKWPLTLYTCTLDAQYRVVVRCK